MTENVTLLDANRNRIYAYSGEEGLHSEVVTKKSMGAKSREAALGDGVRFPHVFSLPLHLPPREP